MKVSFIAMSVISGVEAANSITHINLTKLPQYIAQLVTLSRVRELGYSYMYDDICSHAQMKMVSTAMWNTLMNPEATKYDTVIKI